MLLRELAAYAARLEAAGDLPPRMYQPTRIRWFIDLTTAGELKGFVSTTSEGAKGPDRRGALQLAPHVDRRYAIKPKLLADRADYALGLARTEEPADPERLKECHASFVRCVRDCADAVDEPSLRAVADFLLKHDASTLPLPDDIAAGDVVTFRVGSTLPIALRAVREYWANVHLSQGDSDAWRTCLICGETRLPAERHPVPIKGVPGGQTAGMQLISANENAFESYGLSASLVAPVCHVCAERYAQALNALLRGEQTRLLIGPIAYVFWTREEGTFSPVSLLSSPEPAEVAELLKSPVSGRAGTNALDDAFFAAALSASGGRVVVRTTITSTVAEVKRNLARYFRLQRLVGASGEDWRPLGVFPLAASLVRDQRELRPRVVETLVRIALGGGPLPRALIYEAVRRSRVDTKNRVTRPRIALVKMVLASNLPHEQGVLMEQLDPHSHDPAYLCGRLLAILEATQNAAVRASATIVDRFYGSASTSPQSVFPRLIRGSQPHLSKLRKERQGTYYALQERMETVLKDLSDFPTVLTLNEQGLFALGYYHQRADDRRAATERREAREAASVESSEPEPGKGDSEQGATP